MAIVADADLVGSFTLVAVMVTVEFWVTVGAVKLPLMSIEPPEPATPAAPVGSASVQVTPAVLFMTVAVNCMVCPLAT